MRLAKRIPWAVLCAAVALAACVWARPAAAQPALIGEVLDLLHNDYVDAATLEPRRLFDRALEHASDTYAGVIALPEPAPAGGGAAAWRLSANGQVLLIGAHEAEGWPGLVGALGRVQAFLRGALTGEATGQEIEIALIEGMLRAVDPHTEFFTPRGYREFQGSTTGNIGGIGLVVTQRERSIRVQEVLPGTPAARAGIRVGERIVEIGRHFADGVTIDEAVHLLRGEPGKPIEIGLLAPGERIPRRVKIVRAAIHFPPAEGQLEISPEGAIGYARLRAFQPDSYQELRRLTEPWANRNPPALGMILDLRGNPGGGLNQAIDIADLFLGRGTIVRTVRPGRTGARATAQQSADDITLPLVVLIDERSASASEIVAGAMKNNGRAALIGERSVGKATVQTIYFLPGGNALKLTIAKYLTPGDRSIQGVGVTPHVMLRPVQAAPGAFRLRPQVYATEHRQARLLPIPPGLEPEAPLAVLPYLADSAEAATPGGTEERDEDEGSDRALELARRALKAHAGADPRRLVDTLLRVTREAAAAQEAKIVERMAALGIDWRGEPPGGGASAVALERVRAEVSAEGNAWRPAAEGLAPGQRLRLRVAVRNTGESPAARVLVLVHSGSGAFEDLELPVGWVAPGDRAERTGEWPLEGALVAPLEPLELVLVAAHGSDARAGPWQELGRERLFLPIHRGPEPRYAAALSFAEEGDGNGLLEPGEALAMGLRLVNAGGAGSSGGRLLVQWPEALGTSLEAFPMDVPPLAPHAAWQASARVRLSEDGGGPPWPVVVAAKGLRPRADTLEMHVEVPEALPREPLAFVPPEIELGPLPARAEGPRLALEGRVRDDRSARDVTIRVNGRKAFYLSAAGGAPGPELAFRARLPLEPGWSRIEIVARDGDDLVTRRRIGVWRGEESGLPLAGPPR